MTATHDPQPQAWQLDEGVVLLKAITALLDQAIAAGTQPDWQVHSALCGMGGRLLPPGSLVTTRAAGAGGQTLEELWDRATPTAPDQPGSAAIRDVVTYRLLLRDELVAALSLLDRAEAAGPAGATEELVRAAESIRLFLRGLQVSVNMVLGEPAEGGVH